MFRRCMLALSTSILLAASPPAKTVAPDTVPHPVAMFLADLSGSGKQKITFKAAALGTHFFFEESAGVTVYSFNGNAGYRKETFLKGYTLPKALKKYGK